MKGTIAAVLVMCVTLVVSIASKSATTRITIIDTDSGKSVDIADEAILRQFNVWTGPGTFANGKEGTEGFIIEWATGTMPRPHGSKRYEVRFYVHGHRTLESQPSYVVFYDRDARWQRGFVYLPGSLDEQYRQNTSAIVRGHNLEGHWFRATPLWEKIIQSVIPEQ